MPAPNSLIIKVKALRELGARSLANYAWYHLGLRSGYLHWRTAAPPPDPIPGITQEIQPFFELPGSQMLAEIAGEQGISRLLAEAEEIVQGKVRLFGGPPVPLQLTHSGELAHWTEYARGRVKTDPEQDIKFIWEPARFGWSYTLGRAYIFTKDERFSAAFWTFAEQFLDANPAYLGPNWVSAQEVALRLIAFVFALRVFSNSAHSTPERHAQLIKAILVHAARIPPTLAYAQAQNNNHLLSEASALFTAGTLLPDHPQATQWQETGWRLFHQGLQSQIAPDGAYMQHSTNYHRLVLQLTLWTLLIANQAKKPFPELSKQRLAAATRWLHELADANTGQAPNLGPNDGAYIQPLSSSDYLDFRPVLQSAGIAFMGERLFSKGPWDEMALWVLGKNQQPAETAPSPKRMIPVASTSPRNTPHVLRSQDSWAYLRAARFTSRPGHADQLHLDLWWQGYNLAQDAGTYLYNTPPPWDNALTHTEIHNTLTINNLDQMTPAGRFLYLDWAQVRQIWRENAPDNSWERLTAQHDGYLHLGIIHQRQVIMEPGDRWTVIDTILPASARPGGAPATVMTRLHWLLPDWPWSFAGESARQVRLSLASPYGAVTVEIEAIPVSTRLQLGRPLGNLLPLAVTLTRGGELLHGKGPIKETWGWVSRNYGYREPALSLGVEVRSAPPLHLTTQWVLPSNQDHEKTKKID